MVATNELTPQWKYTLISTNETKRTARPGVPVGLSWELIGVDGSVEGGLRPFPGFKFVHELSGALSGVAEQELAGFFQVTFRASVSEYAYGSVYRVRDAGSNVCRIFLEYRIGQSTTWVGPVDLVGEQTHADKQMNVTVFGRFVYVLVEGNRPFVFYLEEDAGVFTLRVVTDTGPGKQPEIHKQSQHVVNAVEDIAAVLAEDIQPQEAVSRARFLFFNLAGADAEAVRTNANIAGNPVVGPTSLSLWVSPPQPDPEFSAARFVLTSGTFSHEWPGRWWRDTDEEAPRPMGLHETATGFTGGVGLAYILYDSRTARRTQPSPIFIGKTHSTHLAQTLEGAGPRWGGAAWENDYRPIMFPAIDLIYNSDKFDTLLVYRSIPIRTTFEEILKESAFVLKLDSVVTLADHHTDTQPSAGAPWRRAFYFLNLTDPELVIQENFPSALLYLDEMPTGGSSIFYESTMLVGKTGTLDKEIGGLGVVHWSSLVETSVELFTARDRYSLMLPDEEVERFLRLGANVLAVTRHSQYLARRESLWLKFFPLHLGFGVTNGKACCEVGSDVYFVTEQGVKVIDSSGSLDDVRAVDYLIQNKWKGTLGQVEMAFDPTMKAIFLLNPELEEAVVFWMQTGMVTELRDCPFTHVSEGNFPYEANVEGSPLEPRALFVQPVKVSGTWTWRIFTVDYARQKNFPLMLDPTGPLYFTLESDFTSGDTITIAGTSFGTRIQGCKLYVLDGPLAGRSATITARVSNTVIRIDPASNLHGITTGTRLGLSPVYFQWVGHQLGMISQEGVPFADNYDFFSVRQVDTVACAFVDVDGPVIPGDHKDFRFQALLYRGNEEDPISTAFPVGLEGEKVTSIEDGASSFYAAFGETDVDGLMGRQGRATSSPFPGVAIFLPGLDFRLLSVLVAGTIRDSQAITRQRI